MRNFGLVVLALGLAALSGCGPDYSPNTYASTAVQQANKVEQGVVVGVRSVDVSAAGTVGAATGAAAGGIAGSQTVGGVGSAFGALGGALVGGLVGTAAEHASADTGAFEYIVRKAGGELVSVTQKDAHALPLGQKVLVIAGSQARIVPDYTVSPDAAKLTDGAKPADGAPVTAGANATIATAPRPDAVGATPLAPPVARASADDTHPTGLDTVRPVPLVPPPLAPTVAPEVVPAVGARDTTSH